MQTFSASLLFLAFTVRCLAASLLPLVYEHPSLVLLVLPIVSYVLHILSGYPLQVGTDSIPRDESADGRQMLVFAFFIEFRVRQAVALLEAFDVSHSLGATSARSTVEAKAFDFSYSRIRESSLVT